MRRPLARQTFVLLMAKVAIICAMQRKLHDVPPGSNTSTTSWPEVYVINLEERRDKCLCMQQQLRGAPWPTHRFDAVNMNDLANRCPQMASGDDTIAKKNAALVCSNLQIWRKFLNESTASHLVVFEDDVILPDPHMWDKLQQLIKEPCIEWDYLMIDPWGPGLTMAEATQCNDNVTLTELTFKVSGSQMQVLNRFAVELLVSYYEIHKIGGPGNWEGTPVMDKYARAVMLANDFDKEYLGEKPLKGFAVTAGFAPQARFYDEDKNLSMDPSVECADTVYTTDDRRNDKQSEHAPALFTCPNN